MFNTEMYLLLCKKCGLSIDDMHYMSVGMCFDFIDEYMEMQKPAKERVRKASQGDFDSF